MTRYTNFGGKKKFLKASEFEAKPLLPQKKEAETTAVPTPSASPDSPKNEGKRKIDEAVMDNGNDNGQSEAPQAKKARHRFKKDKKGNGNEANAEGQSTQSTQKSEFPVCL